MIIGGWREHDIQELSDQPVALVEGGGKNGSRRALGFWLASRQTGAMSALGAMCYGMEPTHPAPHLAACDITYHMAWGPHAYGWMIRP